MLGRLDASALPFYSPIAFMGAAAEVGAAIVVIGLLFYFKKWGWLFQGWLSSLDHKRIGIMYIVMALVLLLRGFADAIMMRTQQAVALNSPGYLPADHFNQVFTAHGTIMIFFVAMPMVTGLINLIVPLQIGARDVAFPFLNSVSFFLTLSGAGLVLVSLVLGVFSTGGWTGYPPYTGLGFSPGVGVEYWSLALFISGFGTTLSGLNFIATILHKRAPGMKLMDMPLFTWTALVTAVLMLFSFPALTVAVGLLEMDRLLGMHFFTPDMGGNAMNFVNLLWLWGHPEVYILILPCFGVFSEVTATYSRKGLFGYPSLVYATAAIGVLSFTVWLHHFFTMGSSATVNAVFGVATMIISVPTGVKIFDWLFTMYRGRISMKPAMYWTVGFITTFVIGGMTGVMLAIPPVDYLVHNTTFLIAHFHNMIIPGVLFASFAALNYWFPKFIGFRLDEKWGLRSFWCWLFGFCFAFMPLYALGLMGMPRRMATYQNPDYWPYMIAAEFGAILILCGILCLIVQIVVSVKNRKALADTSGDPWDGQTLEWALSSPPPAYNFAAIPQITRRSAFWHAKADGTAYQPLKVYQDIHMPRNSYLGPIIGGFSFLWGFGITWYMWWLVILSAIVIVVAWISRSFVDDDTTVIPAAEVERLDRQHIQAALPDYQRHRQEYQAMLDADTQLASGRLA